jgi:transposase
VAKKQGGKLDDKEIRALKRLERQLRALEMLEGGHTQQEVAQAVGLSQPTISNLWRAYLSGSFRALIGKPRRGAETKLSLEQQSQFLYRLALAANIRAARRAGGWEEKRKNYTTEFVAEQIYWWFNVSYSSKSYLSQVMRRLGWPLQTPMSRCPAFLAMPEEVRAAALQATRGEIPEKDIQAEDELAASLTALSGLNVTRGAVTFPPDLTQHQWIDFGVAISCVWDRNLAVPDSLKWIIGDWENFGMQWWGEKGARVFAHYLLRNRYIQEAGEELLK